MTGDVDGDGRLDGLRLRLVEMRERQLEAVAVAVAELSAFARSDRAPPELRSIQRRIDRGELTWERVALGELTWERIAISVAGRAISEVSRDPRGGEPDRRSARRLAFENVREATSPSGRRAP